MSSAATGMKLNTIFLKIGAILVLTVGLVLGTVLIVQERLTTNVAYDSIADEAFSNTKLIEAVIGGAVKFGKSDQIASVLEETAADSEDQLVSAVVLTAQEDELARFGGANAELDALAKRALQAGEMAVSEDRMAVAVPVTFGANAGVVGVLATAWTADQVLAQTWQATRTALVWALGAFVLGIALSLLVSGFLIVAPLRKFRTAIQALGDGQYDFEVPGVGRGDEIGYIGRSLATLRGQLEAGDAIQREASFKGAAFMGSSAALMVINRDRVIRYLNPRMLELLGDLRPLISKANPGFDPDALVGNPVEACSFGGVNFRALLSDTSGSGRTILRLGDTHVALAFSGVSDDGGASIGHVIEWSDVTSEIHRRAMLAAIEANLVKAEFTPEGDLHTANEAFEKCLGAPISSLKGRGFAALVSEIDGKTADPGSILDAAAKGKSYIGKLSFATAPGHSAIVDGSITPVCDESGKPIRLLLIGNDVTASERNLKQVSAERQKAEAEQNTVVEALRVGLGKLRAGDLTASIAEPFSGSYEQLRSDYNDALRTLAEAMQGIAGSAENIHNEARDISSTADGLSRRTETNSATLEETAAALDSLTTSVRAAASGAEQADTAVSAAKASAENSGNVVLETVSAMDQIADSSERITSIIKVIDDIAFQTNLLALNAGVEAARAGDAGRGFAVVASEVRALAQRSSNAAREINDLIAESATQVKTGVQLVGKTGQALQEIVLSVSQISLLVSEIAGSSKQQSANLAEINNSVSQLDQSTQQNAARLEETTAASEALRQNALGLVDAVSRFRVAKEAREVGGVVRSRQSPVSAQPDVPQAEEKKRPVSASQSEIPAVRMAAAEWEDF